MGKQRAVYDLTFVDSDGNALFGTFSSGAVSVSDFQTPDSTLSHDRTYLQVPENSRAAEIDFAEGSSSIGSITVGVLDKRQTTTDQATGLVTSKIDQIPGLRAILRRRVPGSSSWNVVMDGVVESYSVDAEDVVVYLFQLRDGREFERDDGLFSSNFVLWGKNGETGPLIDYGRQPAVEAVFGSLAKPLIEAVEPYPSRSDLGINHFARLEVDYEGTTVYGGFATVVERVDENGDPLRGLSGLEQLNRTKELRTLDIPNRGQPTVNNDDGIPRYRKIKIRWRAKGSSDAYTELTNYPALTSQSVKNAVYEQFGFVNLTTTGGSTFRLEFPAIWFGSLNSGDIPTDGQEIEFHVVAEEVSRETPFFWDGGNLGVLLQEIIDGNHSETAPKEQYDTSEITSFQSNSPRARMVLREPVRDRRKWVEEHIYKTAFRAPAFNTQQEIFPATWDIPDNAESVPILDSDTIQDIGQFQHGVENAVRRVNYRYIREGLKSVEAYRRDNDLEDDEPVTAWERFVEEEIELFEESSATVTGAKVLDYEPLTIRGFGEINGQPPVTGGGADDLGHQLAEKAFGLVLKRFAKGAPTYKVRVTATDTNLGYKLGDWLRVRVEWLPEYVTGKRSLRRYMQIYGISDVSPDAREFYLVDGGVPDPTADEDLTDPGDVDCFAGGTDVGGTLAPAPSGASLRYFTADGYIVNSCSKDLTVKLLMIAGGGGGGAGDGTGVGGGGGAGGVLTVESVTIAAGESIPVTVGGGGAAGTSGNDGADGEDSVVWVDPNDGTALDPDTDPAPSETNAIGGGGGGQVDGGGQGGGSGGGGGATFKGETADNTAGGGGTTGQGNSGGGGQGHGGSLTDESAGGGGGGSFLEEGGGGSANVAGDTVAAGEGGSEVSLTDWGVTAGGGGQGGIYEADISGSTTVIEQDAAGSAGSGRGAGGGGGSPNGSATPGGSGFVAVIYAGAEATLAASSITSTAETDTEGLQITISDDDWPVIDLDGYRVRVEYAVGASGDSEPAEDSGDWRLAGYLTDSGSLVTDPIPTGSKVWKRVRAEADDFQPSDWGSVTSEELTQTPDFLSLSVSIDADGVGTASWTANSFTSGVRVRAKVHNGESGVDLTRDLTKLDDVVASVGEYEMTSLTIARGQYVTVDLEAWEDELLTIERSTSGLTLHDDFNRADSTTVGNGWTETAGDWKIASNHLRIQTSNLSARKIENSQSVGTGDFIAQMNFLTTEENSAQSMFLEDGTNGMFLNVKNVRDPTWRLVKQDESPTDLDTLNETVPADQWHTMRLVHIAAEKRLVGYRLLNVSGQDDLSGDPVEILNAVYSGSAIDVDRIKLQMDLDIAGTDTFDQDEVFICGRDITITGLPSGWKAQIDSRTAVVETSGAVTFDVDTWALPATTIKVLNDSDEEIDSLSPSGGIWGGDQFTFTSDSANTQGNIRRVTKQRTPETEAEEAQNAFDRLTFDRDSLSITLDRDLDPVKTRG